MSSTIADAPGAVDAPPPDAATPRRDRFRPRLPAVVALLVATAFVSAAATYWWVERGPQPGAADVGFYDDMTTHHFQAIEMANIYMRNGEDELLRNMAWEVVFVQSGDIRVMQNALGKWGKTGNPDVAMEWMDMRGVAQDAQPGMATDDEMTALEQARGRELDDIFTRLMMNHHAGGVHMASAAAARARIGDVRQFARLMASAQQFEIGEFDFARKQLGLPSYEPKL